MTKKTDKIENNEKLPGKRDMELEPFCPFCEFFYPETEECEIICCDDPFKGPDETEEEEYQKDIIDFLLKKHKKFYNKKKKEPREGSQNHERKD